MSLSDCPRCWETPCSCGEGWQHYSDESRKKYIRAILVNLSVEKRIEILTYLLNEANNDKQFN